MSYEESVDKGEIIAKHRIHDTDVGSPEVQIALLTSRIENLARHFEKHREDKHSKRGMMAMISRRKSLLQYLKEENVERYRATLAALGLRK
jgi:small subunit ribosomal protein S15